MLEQLGPRMPIGEVGGLGGKGVVKDKARVFRRTVLSLHLGPFILIVSKAPY